MFIRSGFGGLGGGVLSLVFVSVVCCARKWGTTKIKKVHTQLLVVILAVVTTSRASIENTPDFFLLGDFLATSQIFDIGIVSVPGMSLHTSIFGSHST